MTTELFSECDKYSGRLRCICRGEADLPLNGSNSINSYRTKVMNLDPIPETNKVVHAQQMKLKERVARTKGRPCQTCGKPGMLERAKNRAVNLTKSVINFVTDGMAIATPEQRQFRLDACAGCPLNVNGWCDDTRGGCGCNINLKIQARAASCPAGKWFEHGDNYRQLVKPTRNMIFHIYPKKGAEWNWHWHIKQIREVARLFNGVIAIGVGTGPNLADSEEVKRLMADIPVTRWVVKPNGPTAELTTFPDLLNLVKTDDENTITFRGHCKGVTKTPDAIEQYWARMMWATCMDMPSVQDALASHIMAGPLKCHEPLVNKYKYAWFYAGTFFWFRNREVFQRDWNTHEETRWWIEQWPGVICSNDEAACLCHDFTDGSVLREKYWNTIVKPSVDTWKVARPDCTMDL